MIRTGSVTLILISGPPGSGKRNLAAQVTALVNGTETNDVFSARAREVFIAEPESKSRRIVVEQVRELGARVEMRATAIGRKVAIIRKPIVCNRRLRTPFETLEEPPANSLLLLLSALPEVLPDTILVALHFYSACRGRSSRPEEQERFSICLRQPAERKSWSVVETAYGLAQGLQRLLGGIRDEIKQKTRSARRRRRRVTRIPRTAPGWTIARIITRRLPRASISSVGAASAGGPVPLVERCA